MTSSSSPRALVVSIHDVSPLTLRSTEKILNALEQLGVNCCSLLVVPDHHHRGHFLSDRTFCEWLVAQNGAGHEIVMHGYYHQREQKAAESLRQKLITRSYTAGEGEFYDIEESKASALVMKAQEEFGMLGFHPTGFIAPAWLLSSEGESALKKAGIRYTTRLKTVLNLTTGAEYRSMSLVYSVRTAWRRVVSLMWNATLYRRLKSNPLLRISIHPPDLDHRDVWRQLTKYISQALEDRTPITYWKWVCNRPDIKSGPLPHHVKS